MKERVVFMTIPVTETHHLLNPREEGISEEEAERRRVAAKQSSLAPLDSWVAEGESATEEDRRHAEEERKRGLRELRAFSAPWVSTRAVTRVVV